jgi:hypothetical protein
MNHWILVFGWLIAAFGIAYGVRPRRYFMDETTRSHSHALRVARWQVFVGWAVLFATLIARLTTVALQFARSSHDLELLVESLAKSALLVVLLVFYTRHRWPSYFLLALWPVNFALTWWLAHPPLGILLLGVGVGLAWLVGAHGMRTIHRLRTRGGEAAA